MPEWIDDPAALDRAVSRLAGAPLLAVDLESNAMHAYLARTCVVQLAAARPDEPAEDVVLVDTLALGLGALAELLSARGPRKVFHDLGYDARLLAAEGVTLGNVVDTAVHARMLGVPETGLASLMGKRFGVALDKRFQHHDWGRRPVRDDARRYLVGDVANLGRLHAALAAEVAAMDVADEVACETAWSLSRALDDATDPERAARPPYARIKGYRELRGVSRAILRELAAAREAIAAARDVPIGRILPNAMLVSLARARPTTREAVAAALGAMHASAPWAGAWWRATEAALEARELPADERRWFAQERTPSDLAARRAKAERLTAWRRTEAARRGVDLQVVLPGHCVEELAGCGATTVDGLASLRGLGEARRARYGEALVALLNETPPARG